MSQQALLQQLYYLLHHQAELGLRSIDLPKSFLADLHEKMRPTTKAATRSSTTTHDGGKQHPSMTALQPSIERPTPPREPIKPIHSLPIAQGPTTAEGTAQALALLQKKLSNCQLCSLHQKRNSVVFGSGNPQARLMFIGEGPGRDEDLQGEPFVGEAGKLLDRMILAMGSQRHETYLCNVIKCRPPQNRDPEEEEISRCLPFLQEQIRLVNPQIIVSLGKYATQSLLGRQVSISKLRGQWLTYGSQALMPTFHPAYLLRNPQDKKLVWLDLQMVMKALQLSCTTLTKSS